MHVHHTKHKGSVLSPPHSQFSWSHGPHTNLNCISEALLTVCIITCKFVIKVRWWHWLFGLITCWVLEEVRCWNTGSVLFSVRVALKFVLHVPQRKRVLNAPSKLFCLPSQFHTSHNRKRPASYHFQSPPSAPHPSGKCYDRVALMQSGIRLPDQDDPTRQSSFWKFSFSTLRIYRDFITDKTSPCKNFQFLR